MKIGDVIVGRYELRNVLGSGGPGELFLAWDSRRRREVAVEVFEPAQSGTEKLEAMSALIAAASSVELPSVVLPRIQDGLRDRPPFLVGDHVPGEDIAAVLARTGAVPWQRSIDITHACAEALAALMKASGSAHRALKPGHIRLTPTGDVRLLGFGAAELGVGPVGARADGSFVDYRAPEQLDGTPGDARSDVYTLGVLLFELMTGVHPFSGPSAFQMTRKVLTQSSPPRPSELAPAVPIPMQVEALVVRALARQPAERFKDAADMARHLALVRRSPGELVRKSGRPSSPDTHEEEATQHLRVLEVPEELTTCVSLPLSRISEGRPKAASGEPSTPSAEKPQDAHSASKDPLVVAPDSTRELAVPERKENVRADERREAAFVAPPAPVNAIRPLVLPAGPPVVDEMATEAEERTALLPRRKPDEEKTFVLLKKDRIAESSRLRHERTPAEAAPDTTLELPPTPARRDRNSPSITPRAEVPDPALPAAPIRAASDDITMVLLQERDGMREPSRAPDAAGSGEPSTHRAMAAPVGTLHDKLLWINLACAVLVALGLVAVWLS